MVISESLYDEMVKISSHIDGSSVAKRSPHSGHNTGIVCRGEAGDTRYASQSLIPKSPASPLHAQSTKSTIMEMFLMMCIIRFHRPLSNPDGDYGIIV